MVALLKVFQTKINEVYCTFCNPCSDQIEPCVYLYILFQRVLAELDIPTVTGIIVGVCLGLICILLCMCFSFRNIKPRC